MVVSRPARGFLLDAAGIVLISVIYVLQLVSTTPGAKEFWWNLRFVPIPMMAAGYMLMAVEYTNHGRYVTKPVALGIVAVPAAMIGLVWTNDAHGLAYDYTIDDNDPEGAVFTVELPLVTPRQTTPQQ